MLSPHITQKTVRADASSSYSKERSSQPSPAVQNTAQNAEWDSSYLMTIFESSVDVIISIDPRGTILACNPATTKMFGYQSEELIDQKINKLMPPKERSEHDSYLKKYATTGNRMVIGQRREVEGQKKDGTRFPIELCVSEAKINGKTIYTGIIRDISVRIREEEELKTFARDLELSQSLMEEQTSHLTNMADELHAARLEADKANQTKSQFLANMSHEIRTPMTAILGYTDILLEELEPESFLHESASVVKRNGNNLLELINDILDISKIESGQLTIEHIPCSPRAIVQQVATLLNVRAEQKKITLKIDISDSVPHNIISDPTRLRQILVNLLGNAIKFTDEGTVHVKVTPDAVRSECLRFDITDSGIGIAADKQEDIFKPFQQSDNSTTRNYGGTGLGLTICRQLVSSLEGELTLKSELGKGSTFSVLLPLQQFCKTDHSVEANSKQLPIPAASTEPQSDQSPRQPRILVVEDGEDNRKLISLFLSKTGIHVTTANNGQEAIDVILSSETDSTCPRFDLIFMDMQMPVLDGYSATRQLRQQGFAGIIVALTAHALTGDRKKCLDAGCDDFLSKPITRKQLTDMVNKHLVAQGEPSQSWLG